MPTTMTSDMRPSTAVRWETCEWDVVAEIETADASEADLRAEAESLMPSNDRLHKLAARSAPPAEWWDEESPF